MLYRCTEPFTTTEGGIPTEIEEGSVWFEIGVDIVDGGYEVAVLERVEDGVWTGIQAMVRLERTVDCFEMVPVEQCAIRMRLANE